MLMIKDDATGMVELKFELSPGRLCRMEKKKWFKKFVKFVSKQRQVIPDFYDFAERQRRK